MFESTCLVLHVALSPNLEVGFIKTCPVEACRGHKLNKNTLKPNVEMYKLDITKNKGSDYLINFEFTICLQPESEFKEYEPRLKLKPRLKYGWFHLKLYLIFQDLGRRSMETGFWQI